MFPISVRVILHDVEYLAGNTIFRTWTDPATSTNHSLRQLDDTSCGELLFEPVMP